MLTEGREYLKAAVQEYMKEIGVPSLKWVPSPFIDDKFDNESAKEGEQAKNNTFSPYENYIFKQTVPRRRLDHYNLPREASTLLVLK